MSRGFKRSIKCRSNSPTYPFRQLINKPVEITRPSSDTNTVLHASFDDKFMEIKYNHRKNKLHGTNRIESHIITSSFSNTNKAKNPFRCGRIQASSKFFLQGLIHAFLHQNSTRLMITIKWNKLNFPTNKINKALPAPPHNVSKFRCKSRNQMKLLPQISIPIISTQEGKAINDTNIPDNIRKNKTSVQQEKNRPKKRTSRNHIIKSKFSQRLTTQNQTNDSTHAMEK